MPQPPSTAATSSSPPPARIRIVGKAITQTVARFPFLWGMLRGPTRRFFDRAAPGWDQRVQPDSARHLGALQAAVAELPDAPRRILDLGTGTGAAALWLAGRFPDAEVVGVDIAPTMVEAARAKLDPDLRGRVRFELADAATADLGESFDLIAQVSVPVFFGAIARALAPGGWVVIVSSSGPKTPFHTPPAVLERGFARRGIEASSRGSGGTGTYFVARRPA